MTKEYGIKVIEKQIHPLVKTAEKLEIVDARGMEEATEQLSKLNKIGDKITEEKERVTKPLNEALKAERARWKPIETVYEQAISIIRGKMSAYQTAEIKRQREEEARIAARVGEGKGKLKVETAVRKLEEVEKPVEQVNAASGMVKFREDKVLKITDEKKIPREYLVVDERKLLADLKAGKVVPGAEVEIKMVPLNFR